VRRLALALTLLGVIAGAAGCGSKGRVGDQIPGTTLTIYSSGPLHGDSSINADSALLGEQLALDQIHGRIGRYRIVLRPLDDSTPQRGEWDPGQTTLNARQALADRTTIAYLGEFNSGASAISIPILNREAIPQISPASTAVGLTSSGPGASPGEPQKYYPTGQRTFSRVIPSDAVEAAALVRLQQRSGCRRAYVVEDGGVDGPETADSFTLAAQAAGLQVVAVTQFQPNATDYSPIASAVASSGANCVLIAAVGESSAALVTRQIAAAVPSARLFASAGVADRVYADAGAGGIPLSVDRRVLITAPAKPYMAYGHEAMSLLLSAIAQATDHGTRPAQRSKVLAAIFRTRNRHSPIGTYSINGDGDTSLTSYGVYRVVGGRLRLWTIVAG
jgi:branched-chain amino acid transport system substrate-binding protein